MNEERRVSEQLTLVSVRRLGSTGRLLLREALSRAGFRPGDVLAVYVQKGQVIIKRVEMDAGE